MKHYKISYRKTWQYKIKMWLYRITFRDIKNGSKIFFDFVIEIIMAILGFILLFIIPAFLH